MPSPWLLGWPGRQGPFSHSDLPPAPAPSDLSLSHWPPFCLLECTRQAMIPPQGLGNCSPPHLELFLPIVDGSLHHLFPLCSMRLSLPVLTHLLSLSSSFFFSHYHVTYHSLYLFIYYYLSQQKLKEGDFYLFYPPFLKEGLTHARHSQGTQYLLIK